MRPSDLTLELDKSLAILADKAVERALNQKVAPWQEPKDDMWEVPPRTRATELAARSLMAHEHPLAS